MGIGVAGGRDQNRGNFSGIGGDSFAQGLTAQTSKGPASGNRYAGPVPAAKSIVAFESLKNGRQRRWVFKARQTAVRVNPDLGLVGPGEGRHQTRHGGIGHQFPAS